MFGEVEVRKEEIGVKSELRKIGNEKEEGKIGEIKIEGEEMIGKLLDKMEVGEVVIGKKNEEDCVIVEKVKNEGEED